MEKPMLHLPPAALDDAEGNRIPDGLPVVIDAHVFPDGIFSAVWEWFDRYAWDRELKRLTGDEQLMPSFAAIFNQNASEFYDIPISA